MWILKWALSYPSRPRLQNGSLTRTRVGGRGPAGRLKPRAVCRGPRPAGEPRPCERGWQGSDGPRRRSRRNTPRKYKRASRNPKTARKLRARSQPATREGPTRDPGAVRPGEHDPRGKAGTVRARAERPSLGAGPAHGVPDPVLPSTLSAPPARDVVQLHTTAGDRDSGGVGGRPGGVGGQSRVEGPGHTSIQEASRPGRRGRAAGAERPASLDGLPAPAAAPAPARADGHSQVTIGLFSMV